MDTDAPRACRRYFVETSQRSPQTGTPGQAMARISINQSNARVHPDASGVAHSGEAASAARLPSPWSGMIRVRHVYLRRSLRAHAVVTRGNKVLRDDFAAVPSVVDPSPATEPARLLPVARSPRLADIFSRTIHPSPKAFIDIMITERLRKDWQAGFLFFQVPQPSARPSAPRIALLSRSLLVHWTPPSRCGRRASCKLVASQRGCTDTNGVLRRWERRVTLAVLRHVARTLSWVDLAASGQGRPESVL